MYQRSLLLIVLALLLVACSVTTQNVKSWYLERNVEKLLQALNDKSPDVRDAAAKALGKIGDVRPIKPIIIASLHGSISEQTATQALVGITDPLAIEPLVEALANSNLLASRPATKALVLIQA